MNQRLTPRTGLAVAGVVLSLSMALSAVSIAKCVPEPITTIEMRECAAEEFKTAEQALKRMYQALLCNQTPTAKEKLTESQQAWQDYRDAQCAFEASQYEGGSISPLVHAHCLVQQTKDRTQLLKRLSETH